MITIPGEPGKDLCDPHLKVSRRDLLRIGGSSMMGLGLANILKLQARAAEAGHVGGPGWGKAKRVILCYLQGGPSHLDGLGVGLQRQYHLASAVCGDLAWRIILFPWCY